MSTAQRERAAIVEAFERVGPDAPTLCEGWTARDLAAHLVVRERRLDAAAGIFLPPLSGYTEKVQKKVAGGADWNTLVEQVASGPPVYSPFKLIDPLVNSAEMFIHHEDVRRAAPGWEPRDLDADLVKALRRPLPLLARLILAKAPARVSLRTDDGDTVATVGRGPAVTVTGRPEELLLFLFGRDDAVRIDITGDSDVVDGVRKSRQSM